MIFPWDKIWEAIDKKIDDKVNAKIDIYLEGLEDRRYADIERVQKEAQSALKAQILEGFEDNLKRTIEPPTLSEVAIETYRGVESVKKWWTDMLHYGHDPLFGSELPASQLYDDYEGKVENAIGRAPFGKFFWAICPHLTSRKKNNITYYTIPGVEQCRVDFVNVISESREWCGLKYNPGCRVPITPAICSKKNLSKRLDESLARNVKTLLEVTQDHRTISKLTGVPESTVYNIKVGQSFKKLSPWPLGREREACYDLLGRKELAHA